MQSFPKPNESRAEHAPPLAEEHREPREADLDETRRQALVFDAFTATKLELTLSPTEKCNFRCVYCYEDFSIGRMRPAVIAGVRNLILARAPGLKSLQISWFGGEPLLAYDIVTEIGEFASRVAREHDIRLVSGMTTNGALLNAERFVRLTGMGVREFQISLDGHAAAHDQTRLRKDGSGTFAQIWTNVLLFEALKAQGLLHDAKITLRLHIHQQNMESVLELARTIRDALTPANFNVHLRKIAQLGADPDDRAPVIHRETDDFRRVRDQIAAELNAFTPETELGLDVCYAAKGNAFFIRPDGRVSKCTVALSDDFNTIGSIHEDGRLTIDPGRLTPWLHGFSTMDAADLACPLMRIAAPVPV